ncbi:MAG: hypothetical protein LC803_06175 [Acidobacteria bacterium]|nr:hypothetical protein [Acidobacteriota bacterium]
MSKKILSSMLIALLINMFMVVMPVRAGAQVVEQTRNVERVKENVRKLGIGEAARLELKLWDGRKLKGYLREAGEDDFTVADVNTGGATTLAYAQVKGVKGSNRSDAAQVGLTLAKGAAIVGAIAIGFTLLMLVTIPKT